MTERVKDCLPGLTWRHQYVLSLLFSSLWLDWHFGEEVKAKETVKDTPVSTDPDIDHHPCAVCRSMQTMRCRLYPLERLERRDDVLYSRPSPTNHLGTWLGLWRRQHNVYCQDMISKEALHKYRAEPKTTHSQTYTFNCPRGGIKLRASLHIPTFSHQWLSGNLNIHHQNQTIRPLCLRRHRSVEIHMLVKISTNGSNSRFVSSNWKRLEKRYWSHVSIILVVWCHSTVQGNVPSCNKLLQNKMKICRLVPPSPAIRLHSHAACFVTLRVGQLL